MPYPRQLRYLEIASTIRKRIEGGRFRANSLLPSQKELARIFNTSVMTVRQALSVLEREGLIIFEHGVGTFVSSGGMKDRVYRLLGFQDEMDRHRIRISTKILEKSYSISDERISLLFGIKSDRRICRLTRLRLIGNIPIVFQRSFLPPEFADVVDRYSEEHSLYSFLSRATGQIVVRGNEIILPIPLEPEIAEILRERAGTSAFVSYRTSSNLAGKVVLFDEAYLSGNRIVISSQRLGHQCTFHYNVIIDEKPDPISLLSDSGFWKEWE